MMSSSRGSSIFALLLIQLRFLHVMSLAASSVAPRNVVVVGGGIQGVSVAYHIAKRTSSSSECRIVVLESQRPASAASGKGGGFMARSWGDGSPTQQLHHKAFDMYADLAVDLKCGSYRKLPVLSVSPGYDGLSLARKKKELVSILPDWLDGTVGRVGALGWGDDTAQITPLEFVEAMLADQSDRVEVIRGTCVGVETDQGSQRGNRKITAVQYVQEDPSGGGDDGHVETQLLPADAVIVSAGPWSSAAEDWFPAAQLQLPMEGIKSTSIVWKKPSSEESNDDVSVDATALFCGEDHRFGTHLEVYPRPDGTIYICGVGGSDYIRKEDLKNGAFRATCDANPTRTAAAMASFQEMSSRYKKTGELDRSQACMRPCPPDGLPYMGKIPRYEGAFMNAGHNCWGIAWAPACGLAMSELVLDGESSTFDLSPFEPVRFTPTQMGSRGRKKKGTSVGEQW